MQSSQQCQSIHFTEGRWSQEEHLKFLDGIVQFGKDWKIVENLVKTRTGAQVRSHAQKFFIKLKRTDKERKKGKNISLIQPSEIQKEILNLYSAKDLTPNTPIEVKNVVTTDWMEVQQSFRSKRQKSQANKGKKESFINEKKNIQEQKCNQQKYEEKEQSKKREIPDNQQQSYFIRLIKSNKEHFFSGHDFKQLMDFGHYSLFDNEESVTRLNKPQQRKKSFSLPEKERNQNRLKQALAQLHIKNDQSGDQVK